MTSMTSELAVMAALHAAMATDERVLLLGTGVATRQTALLAAFGAERVRNTPLAEAGVVGCALGAAAMGLRPVVQLQSPLRALDLLAHVPPLGPLSGGQFEFPLVLLAGAGDGLAAAIFRCIPALQVLLPGAPAEAADLLRGALGQPWPSLLLIQP
ncbi:pyruvate dehydrogenase E1 component beta subunit [Pelomonas aquatica]|uniref:Pyruvate dehydrogenase E1 component beta subunit n=1 Tax=Pelomonas aquatica TaxID=431058 RepID=A0ABU1Z660_9BURK|nr:hypothetical protein [Pelomonas aquatica]MDR7296097.1 pyruvate dehydrogenase E1 component beta subunit [Pelomonas aquatica]